MKKFIVTAAIIFSLFGISYGIAASLNAHGVVAAACSESGCGD